MPVPKFNIQQLLNLTNPALMNKGMNITDNPNKYHTPQTREGKQEAVIKEVEYRKRTNPIRYFQKHNSTDTTIKYRTNRNVGVGIDNKGNPTVQEYNTPVKNVEMTGNDPIGEFIVTNAALKAPTELLGRVIRNLFKKKALYKIPTTVQYNVDNSISPDMFVDYLSKRKLPRDEFTLSPADQNLIKMNNKRQIYWIPNKDLQKIVGNNLKNNVETSDKEILQHITPDDTKTMDIVDFINNGKDFNKFNYSSYKDIPIEKLQPDNFKDLVTTSGIRYNTGDVYVNKLFGNDTTPIHEIEHQFQAKISGLDNPDKAFSKDQIDAYNQAYPSKEYNDVTEKSATNKQFQKIIHDEFLKSGQEDNLYNFNQYINNIPNNKLADTFLSREPINSYHEDFQDQVMNNPNNQNQWIDKFREMLKYGTAVAAPISILNNKR